jgi:hypothetical protein
MTRYQIFWVIFWIVTSFLLSAYLAWRLDDTRAQLRTLVARVDRMDRGK